MEIQITIGKDGSKTVHVASLLYDLWEDYNLYRREAESIDRNAEPLRYKRLVQTAILAFFGYFEGVLNTWVSRIAPTTNLEETPFVAKIGVIRKAIRPHRQREPWLDVERARAIRNAIVHVKPTNSDIELMETLLAGQFFIDADRFINWLNRASHRLKYECHPDVPAVLKTCSEE